MDIQNVLKANRVTVVGTLEEYGLEVKHDTKGSEYISGQIVVKSNINGREQLTPIDFYSKALTKENKPNKLFSAYVELETKLGKRISVQAEIQENRYYQESTGQVVGYSRLAGRFINDAKTAQVDQSTFEYAGYVVSPVSERLNKENELLFHEITIAHANYNGTLPVYVKFAIRDAKKASVMADLYETGVTVKVTGDYVVETESNEVEEETAFGDPIKKSYTSTFRNFVINSGTAPAEKGAYTNEDIAELEAAYREAEISILDAAKDDVLSGKAETTNSNTKVKTGLGKSLL